MQRETFLAILLVALVANLCLMLIALLYRRRGRAPHGATASRATVRNGNSALADPTPDTALAGPLAVPATNGLERLDMLSRPSEPSPPPPKSDLLTDPETGLPTWVAWDDMIGAESARAARYHRAVTVVVAELDGLDALAARLGTDVADGLIRPVADAMRRNARAADRIARIGHARFAALLPETDEIGAINYIERVRSSCDLWLEAGALAVRLAIGWASPATGDLEAAVHLAEERMNADRRRSKADGSARPDLSTRTGTWHGPERRGAGDAADLSGPAAVPTEA